MRDSTLRRVVRSRTMLFAALLAVLGIVETQFALISPLIPDAWHGAVLIVIAAIVAALRAVTTTPLSRR